ncbi:TIGR02302 family protein [Sulfitobacter sp. F26169L]|uniref:TIGR02302 family protein n=1 Tax=Sulfitobacter sp. F26169L TaxID=2996015 RepID=UPI002260818C|nr:TIGR02302 family protein [Sulfitobacter sp. F26169L]MCX7567250.1 TIGR02302 family protein [Sulfitobacter sp. F26169L]
MDQFSTDVSKRTLAALQRPLRLTRLGMFAEVAVRSLWPMMSVIMFALAAAMLGLHEAIAIEWIWALVGVTAGACVWAIAYAVRRWSWPTRTDAMVRLDNSLPGHPLTAILDAQAIGAQDDASAAVWRAHQRRMSARAAVAQAVPADLRVSARDPYALRYVAVLMFGMALLFGSVWRVGTVAEMVSGGTNTVATGPVWEGWAEPPRYTGKPTLYLNDQAEGRLVLPIGTLITMRLYGEVGALDVVESVSGAPHGAGPDTAPEMAFDFKVNQSGEISVSGANGRSWDVAVRADAAPEIVILGAPKVAALGEMRLPFAAKDDYGVEAGEARIMLDLASVERRYGLEAEPDPRAEITVPLPMPIAGDRTAFEENLIDDFSQHPWANLPVTVMMTALDAAEQQAQTAPMQITLPGRRFFDPTAAAVIEMRRDILWSVDNSRRSAQILRAISYLPEDVFRSQTTALRLRKLISRIETQARYGMDEENRTKLAQDMWDLALELEEGDLEDARERMRRAQERLNEAMKNGASDEEIAELMQELRRATEEYMQQLQREQAERRDGQDPQEGEQGETMQMTQDDLQRMMDRIQELMKQGRMAEAEQALQELQELMENMQVTQGEQGEGGQSAGEQAMEGLADTLREQQGLSDRAFRDLQEQFNPNAQAGENPDNEGRNGGQGRGESHEGQQGQGEDGQEENAEQGGGDQSADDRSGRVDEQDLAQRQQQLRDELRRQEGRMPGQGTPEGDAARESLDRAGEAMDQAEQNLRNGELAEAIDNQSQAMEALRESMRSLGEAIAQEERDQQPGQGTQDGDRRASNRDPLGRDQGNSGATGSDSEAELNDDAYGRARELLDEIRRRSGEATRPEVERDYLNRLLDRF